VRWGYVPAIGAAPALTVASGCSRTPRNFDVDGPHVITGPGCSSRAPDPGDPAVREGEHGAVGNATSW